MAAACAQSRGGRRTGQWHGVGRYEVKARAAPGRVQHRDLRLVSASQRQQVLLPLPLFRPASPPRTPQTAPAAVPARRSETRTAAGKAQASGVHRGNTTARRPWERLSQYAPTSNSNAYVHAAHGSSNRKPSAISIRPSNTLTPKPSASPLRVEQPPSHLNRWGISAGYAATGSRQGVELVALRAMNAHGSTCVHHGPGKSLGEACRGLDRQAPRDPSPRRPAPQAMSE